MRIGETAIARPLPTQAANPLGAPGFQALLQAAEENAKPPASEPGERGASQGIRHEILEKGLYQYVRDRQMEKLRGEIREDVLSGMGLSEGDLAALPPEMRQSVEQRVEEEVARRLTVHFMHEVEEELVERQRAAVDRDRSDQALAREIEEGVFAGP